MNLSIHGRNIDVTDAMRDYIEKKVGRLDHYLPTLSAARVELSETNARNARQHYTVQVTLQDEHGAVLRGEERAGEVAEGVDRVVDKLHRQILRYKGKRQDRYQRGRADSWGATLPAEEQEAEEEQDTALVRTKRFTMSPMNAEEAIEQMNLIGHTFFVYYDADARAVHVVYRRSDGDYGLIVPELA